jgi:integrase/recombinase XerC
LDRASEFFTNREIEILADVRPVDAGEFVMSRLDSGLPASVAVLHNRRSALRLLFRIARRLGLVDGDPTLDLKLPPKSSLPSRPLDDDEIELCRDVAEWTSARVAVAWALAEATARGAEIAAVTLEDIDLEAGRVSIVRSSRTLPRVGTLSNWGAVVLRRCVDDAAPGPLAYAGDGRGIAGQVSTCRAIGSVLLRSGLSAESDVRPMSVAAWAGRGVLERTGSIEAAALAMGVRSLDRAARLVGHDWSAL